MEGCQRFQTCILKFEQPCLAGIWSVPDFRHRPDASKTGSDSLVNLALATNALNSNSFPK